MKMLRASLLGLLVAILYGCSSDDPAFEPIRINFGGLTVHQADGKTFSRAEVPSDWKNGAMGNVFGVNDSQIYETYVEGRIAFNQAVPNGVYALTLHFSEPSAEVRAGDRQFDVLIEQETVLRNLDVTLFRDGRTQSALTVTLPGIKVEDGRLELVLDPINGEPILSALEIEPQVLLPAAQSDLLVWEDEFDGETLDANRWNIDLWAAKYVNDEDQAYTDRSENLRLEEGRLVIEAHRAEETGSPEYTSARIHTQNKADILYGRIDVRAKLPAGQGTWPAIWMLPSDPYVYASNCGAGDRWQGSESCDAWPNSGEIDIMEHVGYQMGHVHATVHTKSAYWVNWEQRKGRIVDEGVAERFNDYSLIWSPNRIDAFMNGTHYFRYQKPEDADWQAWPFDEPFHIILNLAVGGNWGRAGGPIDDTIFPVRMEVDSVRVYELPEEAS